MPILDVLKASLAALDPATPGTGANGHRRHGDRDSGKRIDGRAWRHAGRGDWLYRPAVGGIGSGHLASVDNRPAYLRPASNLSFLRIRSQPGINAPVVGQYDKGTLFTILEADPVSMDNTTWFRTADGRGWIAIDFTEPAEDVAAGSRSLPLRRAQPRQSPAWLLPFTANQRGVGARRGRMGARCPSA